MHIIIIFFRNKLKTFLARGCINYAGPSEIIIRARLFLTVKTNNNYFRSRPCKQYAGITLAELNRPPHAVARTTTATPSIVETYTNVARTFRFGNY